MSPLCVRNPLAGGGIFWGLGLHPQYMGTERPDIDALRAETSDRLGTITRRQ
jgi:hypothetical protein